MKKLCFTTVVHGYDYQKYSPYFLYSCLKSYPDSEVKLFFTEKIHKDFIPSFKKIDFSGKFELLENSFKEYPKGNQQLKTIRWLIPEKYFEEYEYVYIGDIDIFICREYPPLLYQHINHCECQNLPYSNMVRDNSKRLTGLHFIDRREYYKKVSKTIEKYSILLKKGKLIEKNENVLYNIIKESGLRTPNDRYRPHHGLHLGIWRKGPRILNDKKWYGVGGRNSYMKYWNWFKTIEKDPLFFQIEKEIPIKELKWMRDSMTREFDR